MQRSPNRNANGRRLATALVVASLCGALGGCGTEMPTPQPTPTPTPTPLIPTGDGIMRLGTVFPTSGPLAFLAPAQVAGVETAVKEVNAAGGVLGVPIEVFHRDSGDATTSKAEESFADLVTKLVDVVIGPSSSVLAERLIPAAAAAKVAMVSPAATFPALTDLADEGYFFRTIPPYPNQGAALGEHLSAAGPVTVGLVFLGDDLGSTLREALESSLAEEESELVVAESFVATTTDFAATIAAVTAAKPDLVVLATPAGAVEQTKALITQLSAAGFGGAKLWLTSQNTADYSQALPAGLLNTVNGIIEGAEPDAAFIARLKQSDPALGLYRYAVESYDATILAALAAVVARDDSGKSVAATLRDVSSGGIKCTSFGECLEVLKTEDDIDYDGISGPLNFTESGDVQAASYGIYAYNAENKFVFTAAIVAG